MTNSRIFITGATGFIGSQVAALALQSGYRVRLSVRKETQIEQVKSRYSDHLDKLETFVIPDLANISALQAALDDVEYIFHLATPMPGSGTDFRTEYMDPAVNATKAVLIAASSTPAIKRVVIVSSILALMPLDGLTRPGLEVTEHSNFSIPIDPDMQWPEGENFAVEAMKYQGSKILAHRATLNWMSEHKPHFQLFTLHPSFVIGTDLTQITTVPTPGSINALLTHSMMSEKPSMMSSVVDVRDVALAHIRALDAPVDDSHDLTEVILCGNPFDWSDLVKFVKTNYPAFPLKLSGPFTEGLRPDTRRAERDLKIKWRSMEETVGSMLDQQKQQE